MYKIYKKFKIQKVNLTVLQKLRKQGIRFWDENILA